jgi:heme-degrading monooxygenase HmoA
VPSMLIRHKVADYAVWQAHFTEHEIVRRANGSQGGRVFRSADNPHEVLILLEWDDLERARLFADSDDLREALDRAGVTDRPDIWFLADGDRIPV